MNDSVFLFVGLGNPGAEYEGTRHNVGFRVVDAIADANSAIFGKKTDFFSEIASFKKNNRKVVLVKPQTFMNLSGRAVGILQKFFKISLENIFVFHDDIDLKFSQIKMKKGGGNAGHNGLRNIDDIVGRDYWRLRIGVGRPENSEFSVASYVLGNFSRDENEKIDSICTEISKNFDLLLSNLGEFDKVIKNISII